MNWPFSDIASSSLFQTKYAYLRTIARVTEIHFIDELFSSCTDNKSFVLCL